MAPALQGRRAMRSFFIAAWLVVQLALPLSYYASRQRSNPYDERFAWRMFSPLRVVDCDARFTAEDADGRGLKPDVTREVHQVWGELLSRGRVPVALAMARRWCDRHAQGERRPRLRLRLTCPDPAGGEVALVSPERDLCGAEP